MRILILMASIVCYSMLFAQQPTTQAMIDSISYNQYLTKQYKEIKKTIHTADENKIDFYYLRLRAGILAFDNKKYEYAITQFKKALLFYPTDSISKEYLYYALLFSDRKEIANDFADKQDIAFRQKVGYKHKPFDFIGVDGGVSYTNNINKNRDKDYISVETGKAERSLNGNLFFGDVFFQNTIKNKLHINNSFSIFNTSALYQIEVKLPTSQLIKNEATFNNLNFQYNITLSYITKKEWIISIGFGYYRVKSNIFTANRPDTASNNIPIVRDTLKLNSFLGSFTLSKRWKYIQPYIQFSASNLNAVTQVQTEAGLVYYPLGNYYLYGATSCAYLRNNSANQFILSQRIGYKITNWFWNEIYFNYGNLANYISNNGLLSYNTSNSIKLQAGIDFRFYAGKHFQINAGYTFQQREKEIMQVYQPLFPANAAPIITSQHTNYFTHQIKTSLLWNF